ncbi:AAA family ATPase [Paucibacter sp. DJ2R-2]|uniref:AAA family ATPase n=1 Tax=Paucibacter sp. DJ2R-2 TaxID=2893558 RepID=UPI0021E48408|nr:AAA family ATPase [Paucibacter sp. DJ2R-2]MCV2439250.1 AAA family ATPase [Paucibacter sp. DJ2R-2]
MNTQINANAADSVAAAAAIGSSANLACLSREEVMSLSAQERLNWFASLRFEHRNLRTVIRHLHELMDPHNDVKLIMLIGPTGIGKTSLVDKCLRTIVQRYAPVRLPHEVPVAFISAPANGERSLSWKVVYSRLHHACGGLLPDQQRSHAPLDGELRALHASRIGVAQRRELLEAEIRNRNVRLLGIDESHHLLRFGQTEAMMDTLKSMADIQPETKLMLVGTYQIAPLMTTYGQLARRGAILHYKRYHLSSAPKDDAPTADEAEFRKVLAKFEAHWPCEDVPNLSAAWRDLMMASLGSVGLLKTQLQQAAQLQTHSKGEKFNSKDVQRAFKANKMLNQIEIEISEGEQALRDACYGDAEFVSGEGQQAWLAKLEKRRA